MSNYKFHGDVNEVVPWQAQYTFPTQSTKVQKSTVKLPPKNGETFAPGQRIRIEFPSDNYLNVLNSVLSFQLNTTVPVQQLFVCTTEAATAYTMPAYYQTAVVGFDGQKVFSISTTATTTTQEVGDYFEGWTALLKIGAQEIRRVVVSSVVNGQFVDFTVDEDFPKSPAQVDARIIIQLIPPYGLRQGGAHNLIKRIRILYGSLVLEDIQEYKTLVRMLTEIGVAQQYLKSSGSILDGTHARGGYIEQRDAFNTHMYADRQNLVGFEQSQLDLLYAGNGDSRKFVLNLMSGLLTSKKLIPLKWMAAQLAIEITLAPNEDVYCSTIPSGPTYTLTDVNYVAELLEFDSTYDSGFFMGLSNMGVPLKFNSWHYHSFNVTGTTVHAQIHERARSVKAAFAVVKDQNPPRYNADPDRFFHAVAESQNASPVGVISTVNTGKAPVEQYQWRIGGRYYPAQPVDCTKGAPEAYSELLKCMDSLGDYKQDCSISSYDWSSRHFGGGGKFIMAAEFEHSDVSPNQIAGLNAEEMSDLALVLKTGASETDFSINPTDPNVPGVTGKRLDVFVNFDALMIVRDGNVVDLVI